MLDNPAWWALNSLHKDFALGTDQARRYRKAILPFIAYRTDKDGVPADVLDDLDPWIEPGETFYIIGRLPILPKGWITEFELPCAQMVLPAPSPATTPTPLAIEPLGHHNATEMFELINRIQPGYYNIDTRLLGNYYGIRQQGRLIAMAGERVRIPGFSELSAICTDPAYTGLGYAQQLIAHIGSELFAADVVPFLHVALSNQRAIRLYEHMGFQHRREISFWRCRKG
jgi:GNAT superfamily N-acetyltransferase